MLLGRVLGRRVAGHLPGSGFPAEVIVVAVRWYLRYGLSYRDVEELLAERRIEVDHVTSTAGRLEMLRRPAAWSTRGPLRRWWCHRNAPFSGSCNGKGCCGPGPRKRPKASFVRWERPAPMQLW